MNDGAKQRIKDSAEKLVVHTNIIQFQVLNNLDLVLNQKENSVDKKLVDELVKGPLMKSVAQIRHCRASLLEAIREGKLPSGQKEKGT
jgi:hypothetical protein